MALVVLATNTGEAQAQGLCDTASGATLEGLIAAGVCQDTTTDDTDEEGLCDTATGATLEGLIASGVCAGSNAMDMITSDSSTGSGSPELKLTIASLGMDLAVGSSIVVYLEDDFAEPDSIPMSSVYLVAEGGTGKVPDKTGNGSRVYVTSPVKIKTGAYFDEDKKDIAIRVLVPDMCTTDTTDCQTSDGPKMGQKMTLVIESDSGIKNPSEAGTHSVFFDLVGSADPYPSASNVRGRNDAMRAADPSTERTVKTVAKITLSDVDNKPWLRDDRHRFRLQQRHHRQRLCPGQRAFRGRQMVEHAGLRQDEDVHGVGQRPVLLQLHLGRKRHVLHRGI